MNIAEAKQQVKDTIEAYLAVDDRGRPLLDTARQRPVFLVGAPGIGKTAIMAQIAQELGLGLVSYSMTHHTRQSALGLPFIVHEEFEGLEYEASEYTMSEIIASVYAYMKKSGVRRGILFLDEINCVSETLTPAMLQFLQYKVFGRHRVPDGWIVVTAGNPPEYNRTASICFARNAAATFTALSWAASGLAVRSSVSRPTLPVTSPAAMMGTAHSSARGEPSQGSNAFSGLPSLW